MWAEAVYWVQSTWDEVQYTLIDTFDALGFTWNGTVGDMGVTWADYCAQTKSMWAEVIEWIGETWNWLQTKATEGFATAFAYAQGLDAEATRQAARETIGAYQRGEWTPTSAVPREQRERRERAREARIEEAAVDVADATTRWRDALAGAREAREQVERSARERPERPGQPGVPDFTGAAKGGMTVGTFSKWALGGLGMGGNAAERTAKATELTAAGVDKMFRELIRQGQSNERSVFSE
jgi:hypothetical protein